MSSVVQILTGGSRFMFWAILIVGGALVLSMNLYPPAKNQWVVVVLDLLFVCFVVGLWSPAQFGWIWRILGAAVFLMYLAYAAHQFWITPNIWRVSFFARGATFWNALQGLFFLGLPGLGLALTGVTRKREPIETGVLNPEENEAITPR